MLGRDVFAQRVAGERVPAVGARQLDDAVAEPVEPEAVADHVVHLGDALDVLVACASASSAMSSASGRRSSAAMRAASSAGTPRARVAQRSTRSMRSRSLPRAHAGSVVVSRANGAAKNSTVAATGERPLAVPEQPAARPLHELAATRGTSSVCTSTSIDAVERLDVAPQRVLVEDRARGFVRAHDVGPVRAGLLADAERERGAGPVDQAVHERGRDDLAAQRVRCGCGRGSARAAAVGK